MRWIACNPYRYIFVLFIGNLGTQRKWIHTYIHAQWRVGEREVERQRQTATQNQTERALCYIYHTCLYAYIWYMEIGVCVAKSIHILICCVRCSMLAFLPTPLWVSQMSNIIKWSILWLTYTTNYFFRFFLSIHKSSPNQGQPYICRYNLSYIQIILAMNHCSPCSPMDIAMQKSSCPIVALCSV